MISNGRRNDVLVILFLRKQLTFWCLKLSVIVNLRLVPQKARLSLSLSHNPTGLFMGHYFKAIHSKDHKTVMFTKKEMGSMNWMRAE